MKIAILFIFFPFIAFSQSLIGNYRYVDSTKAHHIKLKDSAEFITFTRMPYSRASYREKGHYFIQGDTLCLFFEPYNNPSGRVEIVESESLEYLNLTIEKKERTWIFMNLFDLADSLAIQSLTMIDLVSKDSVLATVNALKDGRFDYQSSNRIIDELVIRPFSYDPVKLNLNKYRGKSLRMDIYFFNNNYNTYREEPGEAKFLLGEANRYLRSLNEGGSLGPKYLKVPDEN
jgi:hypothetical protein